MMHILEKAYWLAKKYHGTQMYGEMPYMYHLIQVRDSVTGHGADYALVGVLHDILEDTTCTEEILREEFPKDVVDAVVAMTKVDGEGFLEYMERVKGNKIAYVVKIHDTLMNLTESVKTQQWGRVRKYSSQLNVLVS